MKPNDAAKVAASAGTNGFTPAAIATGITMGTTTAADAVLLVVSDARIARMTAKIVMGTVACVLDHIPVNGDCLF